MIDEPRAGRRPDDQAPPRGAGIQSAEPLSARAREELRRSRRWPRATQFDYLHLRYLVDDLTRVLERINPPPRDVLDLYCGTRPYEDMLPSDARLIGLDIDHRYGRADIVTDEFLPFPDASFDLILCTEAFHYVPDPAIGVAEIRRVLRPRGTVVITVPLVWEYNRTILEHRFTGPALAALFNDWDEVDVIENGGRAVSWATLTGRMLWLVERRVPPRFGLDVVSRRLFSSSYLLLNASGVLLDWLERRHSRSEYTLPMNLLLTARRPAE
jgi:SAM-dependent methyltransferase